MYGSRFRDVHDLPVGRENENEPVQCLEEMRTQFFQNLRTFGQSWLHAPTVTETCQMKLNVEVICSFSKSMSQTTKDYNGLICFVFDM